VFWRNSGRQYGCCRQTAVKEVTRFFRIDFDLCKMDLAAFRGRSFGHGSHRCTASRRREQHVGGVGRDAFGPLTGPRDSLYHAEAAARTSARSWRSSSPASAERPLAVGRKRSQRSTPHRVFPAGGCMTCGGHLRQGCSASACASRSPRRC